MIPLALAFLFAATVDPAAVLLRVLAKVRADLRGVPNYTCVETVTREFYVPAAPVRRNCDVLLEMKQHPTLDMKLHRSFTDRLRLEVVMGKSGELHSWVGATRFEDAPIDRIVRGGPVGTGTFAAFLSAIFEQDVRSFRFTKELVVDGRDRLEFSFDVPREDSHYKVRIGNDWAITAYQGSVEVDVQTEELTRIWIQTAILPPAAGTCRSTSDVQIAMTQIGEGRFPLTSVARQRFVASNGEEALNTMRFSSCREYRGESTITFGTEAPPEGAATKPTGVAPTPSIPGDLPFTSRLDAAIDPGSAAAGDSFTATLETSIRDARGRTLAPRGSKVWGRLLRVEQHYAPRPGVLVVLRPESVEVRGSRVALLAVRDFRRLLAGRKKGVEILLPFQWETNAALFRLDGEGAGVPAGYSIDWRTVAK